MHRTNNAVIMQTEQLGRIKALEELRSSRGKMVELEQKITEQDRVIAQLVGVIVMTFWYVFGTDLSFFKLFKLYLSLGIDHDPP